MRLSGLSTGRYDGQVEKPRALTLKDLNFDVLYHILSFVLAPEEVIEHKTVHDEKNGITATTSVATKPHFHTSIMRTNKKMHEIGRYVLGSNGLIRFTASDTALFDEIFGPTSPALPPPIYWTRNVDNAVDVRMELSLTRRKDYRNLYKSQPQETPKSGLILMENLGQWAASVMSYELLFWYDFTLSVDILKHHAASSKIQGKLLPPLLQLRSFTQKCLVPEFLEQPPALYWSRASAFNLYECMLAFSERGDAAYRAGDYNSAATTYTAILRLRDSVLAKYRREDEVMRNKEDDPVLMQNIQDLIDAVTINNIAVLTILGKNYEAGTCLMQWPSRDRVFDVMNPEVRGLLAFCGVLEKLRTFPVAVEEVIDEMAEAAENWPVLSPGVEIIEGWSEVRTQREYIESQSLHNDIMRRLTAVAPKGPLIARYCWDSGYSATIDYERYVLHALGYPGMLFEDRLLQTEGQCAFVQAEADKDVEVAKQQIRSQIAAGKEPTLWLRSPLAWKPFEEIPDAETSDDEDGGDVIQDEETDNGGNVTEDEETDGNEDVDGTSD